MTFLCVRLSATNVSYLEEVWRNRARSLRAVDELIGRLVKELQDAGLLDNTYIMYSSDNGYHLGAHRRGSGEMGADGHRAVTDGIALQGIRYEEMGRRGWCCVSHLPSNTLACRSLIGLQSCGAYTLLGHMHMHQYCAEPTTRCRQAVGV